jgi:hypothetical protein
VTAAVPSFRVEVREYLEIAVLSVTFRAGVKADRLAALVHRAVNWCRGA